MKRQRSLAKQPSLASMKRDLAEAKRLLAEYKAKEEKLDKGLLYCINTTLWPIGTAASFVSLVLLGASGHVAAAIMQGLITYLMFAVWYDMMK